MTDLGTDAIGFIWRNLDDTLLPTNFLRSLLITARANRASATVIIYRYISFPSVG